MTTAHQPARLRCMEIWGGASAVDQAVSVPGIDVSVHSVPFEGGASGGDVYYVSVCGGGNIARIALADVSGHGESVAGVSESLRKLMRKHINTPNQTKMARELNTEFDASSRGGRFATALLATYWAPTDHLIIVNAGHPPPLIRRAETGAWSVLDDSVPGSPDEIGISNLPLGVIEPTTYTQLAVPLAPGDVVLLTTDAVSEVDGPDGRMLGTRGVLDLLERLGTEEPSDIAGELEAALRELRSGNDADDDLTIVTLAHNGSPAPPQSVGDRLGMLSRLLGISPSVRELA